MEADALSGVPVYVALGSNLGNSAEILQAAFERLESWSRTPILRSSIWRTTPVDCPPGSPPFLNAVAALTLVSTETPESLLGKLQALEKDFGRQPKKTMNEPRPLDLDLLAFGDLVRSTATLALPHPHARNRRFVLEPWNEIAPAFVMPGERLTIREFLTALDSPEEVTRLPSPPEWGAGR